MTNRIYPPEAPLNDIWEDDGTIVENVTDLRDRLIGRRIVKAEKRNWKTTAEHMWREQGHGLVLTLDDGTCFAIQDEHDCCAYTVLEKWVFHTDQVDNAITNIETENGYTTWHVLADMKDVLTLDVKWSAGNAFYYAYGFSFPTVEVQPENPTE